MSGRIEIKLPNHDIVLNSFHTEETDPEAILNDAIDHFVDTFDAETLAEILDQTCMEDIVRAMQSQIYDMLKEDIALEPSTVQYHDNISPDNIVLEF